MNSTTNFIILLATSSMMIYSYLNLVYFSDEIYQSSLFLTFDSSKVGIKKYEFENK